MIVIVFGGVASFAVLIFVAVTNATLRLVTYSERSQTYLQTLLRVVLLLADPDLFLLVEFTLVVAPRLELESMLVFSPRRVSTLMTVLAGL